MASSIRLFSPHEPIEVATILKDEMARKWTAAEKQDGRVMGSGSEDDFTLYVARHRAPSLSGYFTGTMTGVDGGTRLEGKMGISGGVRVVLIALLACTGFFGLTAAIVAGSNDAPLAFKLGFGAFPFAMLFGVLFIWRRSQKGAQMGAARIAAFLESKVGAGLEDEER